MAKYFFTYGTSGQPFCGGWTEVEAPDAHVAASVFRAVHPDKTEGLLNCSCMYTEAQFQRSGMTGGNFGACCQERITVTIDNRKELSE